MSLQENEQTESVKEHRLEQDQELRFEVGKKEITLELFDGNAEIFGKPLIRYKKYKLQAGKVFYVLTYMVLRFRITWSCFYVFFC
jgi:hypothetical protein